MILSPSEQPHLHTLNLLFNGDLNLNGLCYRFDEPPSGGLLLREEDSFFGEEKGLRNCLGPVLASSKACSFLFPNPEPGLC